MESRSRSPVLQEWGKMDASFVVIDVSKNRLNIHALPVGESFCTIRSGAGLDELVV
jgi:hypothetical protein